jgi:hypothetical protein
MEGLEGGDSDEDGGVSCGEMGEGGCLVAEGSVLPRRRSLDSMVSSSMTMRCPGSSSMTALSSPRSPKDYSSSSCGSLSWMTSESSARFKLSFPSVFINLFAASQQSTSHPSLNL